MANRVAETKIKVTADEQAFERSIGNLEKRWSQFTGGMQQPVKTIQLSDEFWEDFSKYGAAPLVGTRSQRAGRRWHDFSRGFEGAFQPRLTHRGVMGASAGMGAAIASAGMGNVPGGSLYAAGVMGARGAAVGYGAHLTHRSLEMQEEARYRARHGLEGAADFARGSRYMGAAGAALGPIGNVLAGLGIAGAVGAEKQYGQLGELATLRQQYAGIDVLTGQRPNVGMAASPIYDPTLQTGLSYGLTLQESMQRLHAFTSARGAVGAIGARTGINPLAFSERTGVGMAALGEFSGLFAAGGGMRGDADAMQFGGIASAQGLRGGRIERYLSEIASYSGQMATQGLTLDSGSLNTLLSRMQMTPGLRGRGAFQVQAAGQLGGIAGRARGTMLGGFEDVPQAILMQHVFSRASSFEEAVQMMDQLQGDPNAVANIMQGTGSLGALGLAAGGMGLSAARGLTSLRGPGMFGIPAPDDFQRRMRSMSASRAGMEAGRLKVAASAQVDGENLFQDTNNALAAIKEAQQAFGSDILNLLQQAVNFLGEMNNQPPPPQ